MKVTFIYPKFPYYYARTPYIPLGIGYLAASISDIVDGVSCIDGQILSEEEYESAVANIGSQLVCISATLLQLKEAGRLVCLIKSRLPETKVVVGGYGPHCLLASQLFDFAPFDVFVRGEGELVLRDLVASINGVRPIESVHNIVFRSGGRIIENAFDDSLPDLNLLPAPNRSIFNVAGYLRKWKESTGITSLHLITSRGCPFGCAFCDKSITGRVYRTKDSVLVVDEMEQMWQVYRPDDLFLFDDLFTLRRQHVLEVCRQIRARKLQFKWSAQARVSSVDADMLSEMKNAGCNELFFGVESGSDSVLGFLGKGFTREEVIETFSACHKVGLPAGAYLIVGVPGETKRDIDLTIDLVEKIRPSLINFSFLTPFPNTEVYKKTSQWVGRSDWTQWDDFTKTVYDYPFEVDPQESKARILEAYKILLSKGMPYSSYQPLK